MRQPHDPVRRRLLLGAAVLCAGPMLARRAASADFSPPIEMGILPYLPTASLLAGHQSLRRHFEETFKRPVALSTAPDFRSFQQRVLQGDFDFIIIGPGPGWQAHVDRKHQVIAVSRRRVSVYFLVPHDSPIKSIADLRGKTLATIDPLTVTAQTTMMVLREHKLRPDTDLKIRHEKTPFNCAQAVALGTVAAASFPNVAYQSLPAEIRGEIKIIHESDSMPGVLFMVRPAPNMPAPEAFQAALFRFADKTEAGRAFIKELNHDGLAKPDPEALRVLDRFLPETRRIMAQP